MHLKNDEIYIKSQPASIVSKWRANWGACLHGLWAWLAGMECPEPMDGGFSPRRTQFLCGEHIRFLLPGSYPEDNATAIGTAADDLF